MSYSTFMYIYDWQSNNNFTKELEEVKEIFKLGVPYDLKGPYWEDKEETFEDFMVRNILDETFTNNKRAAFVYCNHDGVSDDEVFRLFIMFGKILTKHCDHVIVKVSSEIDSEDGNVYFIDGENGVSKIEKSNIGFQEEMDYIFANYQLKKSKLELADAEERVKKYEDKLKNKPGDKQ